MIAISDGLVRIEMPDTVNANQVEAVRLNERATERANKGEYHKAVGIWARVIELDPTNVEARRNLGMAYIELKEPEKAREHLIEAATLDPKDAWSYVVLGNILARDEKNSDAAERFYRKAIALRPDDAWAMNSIGAMETERGNFAKAVEWFEKAIAANPKFANAYYGRAQALVGQGKPETAIASIEELFAKAEMQDARSAPVYQAARESYDETAKALAAAKKDEVTRALSVYQEHVEDISGYPVKIEREKLSAMLAGQSQMAWKKKRDHHVIILRPEYPEPLLPHLLAHELTHIALEAEARAEGRNKWFSTTANSREVAIRSMTAEIKRYERAGLNSDKVAGVFVEMIGGAASFLFNAPLDMLIEERLRKRLPDLKYAQYCSLLQLAREAEYATTHKEIRELSPKRILEINDALNSAMALWLANFTGGIADRTASYRKLGSFALGEKLYRHFRARTAKELAPGDEYGLIDDFADMLKMRDWYVWIDDPGEAAEDSRVKSTSDTDADARPEGSTNPELLRSLSPAASMHMLAALERFEVLPLSKVKQIAFEIAVMGMSGLDYASPEKKYRLNAVPDEHFSGLELMCLMHAGLRTVDPTLNTGLDMEEPYGAAKAMYTARRRVKRNNTGGGRERCDCMWGHQHSSSKTPRTTRSASGSAMRSSHITVLDAEWHGTTAWPNWRFGCEVANWCCAGGSPENSSLEMFVFGFTAWTAAFHSNARDRP